MDTLQKLTPQEKNLFKLCFQNGLITYEDLAERLGISLITTRGIVNRLFQDVDKRRLFCKKRRDGFINVGLTEAVEREANKKYKNGLDKNENFSRIVNKNLQRIIPMDGKKCIFSFIPWRSYVIISIMILMGSFIRHSTIIPKVYLSVLYTGIGSAMILSGFRYIIVLKRVIQRSKIDKY